MADFVSSCFCSTDPPNRELELPKVAVVGSMELLSFEDEIVGPELIGLGGAPNTEPKEILGAGGCLFDDGRMFID